MPVSRNNKHSVESSPVVVTAATLKEAYQIVRDEHGPDAVILGSKTVTRRQEKGLGHSKMVEVTIQSSDDGPGNLRLNRGGLRSSQALAGQQPVSSSAQPSSVNAGTCHEIVKEVNRIEELVAAISQEHQR